MGARFAALLRWRLPLRPGTASEQLESLADRERDQLPLWLPVGLGLGTAAWFVLPDRSGWTAFAALALGGVLAPLALAPGTRWGRALAIFSLAALIGCGNIWWKAERVAGPVVHREKVATFEAVIDTVQNMPAEEIVRLVVRPTDKSMPHRIRVNLDDKKVSKALEPGARVSVRAWLMPPPPPAVPGAYDFSRAAWFQGVGATGRGLDVTLLVPPAERSWRARLAGARQRLADHIRVRLPGGEGGIAAALATGDQAGIPEADAEAMRQSGLAHLLSVSGLHLTAVVGAVMLLTLKLLALSPALALRFRLVVIAAGVGAVAGIAYTLFTGAEVPTIRSCVAAILILIGIALGREALTLRLVAVGALVVLLLWPESVVGASFQLSFAAIVAIVVIHDHPRVRGLLERRDEARPLKIGRAILGLILTGLAVEIALTPIALFHFHQAGVYGALANIVAIPLTTFVVMPVEGLALLLDPVELGGPCWWIAGKALGFLLWLAHSTAGAPGAVAMLPGMPRGAFGLVVVGGLWLFLWRTRWRLFGLAPLLAGAIWTLATPAPDLLITGDGAHVAIRTQAGRLAILRPKAGDYVRDTLSENAGIKAEPIELESLPKARCSADLCASEIEVAGTSWRILATRSANMVDFGPLRKACAVADIVISDRRLPVTCVPRWLKADAAFLRRTGGLAIKLGAKPEVLTVSQLQGEHPWAAKLAPPPPRKPTWKRRGGEAPGAPWRGAPRPAAREPRAAKP
ncbi:ComEC/Rec2 family competence protein [Allosphingosinicella deserti]|uniref:ComEC/Rec2 family competence protein n=1 Tax=Allosphingosinicella deserti TaxID=2116704 RepID=UPI001E37544A|nr:ComEC/Rec2 family competence protein [Sphingomonas deserti]